MESDPESSSGRIPGSEPGDGGSSPSSGKKPRYAKGMREAVLEAFDRLGGVDYLVQVGRDDPRTFVAVLNKLLPQAVEVSGEDGQPIAIFFPPL